MERTLRTLALPTLLAPVLAVPLASAPAAPARAATVPWRACSGVLDGHRISLARTTSSVVTVSQVSRSHARVVLWRRVPGQGCRFTRVFTESDGRIGANGTVAGTRRRQGSLTTPRGTYTMTEAFGLAARPRTAMPYRRAGARDYWVEDNASRWYNTWRNAAQGGFRTDPDNAERIADYPVQYRYAVVVDFNRPPHAVRNRGAGIFLHVKGSGATAGCVAVTRVHMLAVLATIRPGDLISIG